MHPALVKFLEEYKTMLQSTENMIEATQEKFVAIQQEIRATGVTDGLLNNLFAIYHNLFQCSYLLMERHLRVNNLRANYSEEDQKIIDSFDKTYEKANKLTYNIISYKKTMTSSDEDSVDLNV